MGTPRSRPPQRAIAWMSRIALVITLHAGTALGAPSAWEMLKEREQFGKFVELVERAGLRAVLEGETTLTLLAPVNAAFDAINDVDRAWMNDPAQQTRLRRLVASHIIWDALPTTEIGQLHLRQTAAGRAVAFRRVPLAPLENTELLQPDTEPAPTMLTAGAAKVVEHDLFTRNGLIHVVDAFVMIETIRTAPESEPATSHAPSCSSSTAAHDEHIRMAMLELHRRAQREREGASRGGSGATDGSTGKPGGAESAAADLSKLVPAAPPTTPTAPMPRSPGSGGGGRGCGCGMP